MALKLLCAIWSLQFMVGGKTANLLDDSEVGSASMVDQDVWFVLYLLDVKAQ